LKSGREMEERKSSYCYYSEKDDSKYDTNSNLYDIPFSQESQIKEEGPTYADYYNQILCK